MRSLFLCAGAVLLALVLLDLAPVASAYPCPAGTTIFNCLSDPCVGVKTCPLGCQSDYCGGCNARCVCRSNRDCARVGGSKCVFDSTDARFGVCDSTAPLPPTPTRPCSKPCSAGQECRDGSCQPSCAVIRCASGFTCTDGQCVADPPAPTTCGTSGVTCQSYETCEDGSCVDGSCAAVTCAEGSTCRGGECFPNEEPVQQCPKCAAGNFCGAALQCQPEGTCSTAEDCSRDPTLITPACVGTYACKKGKCAFTCTSG